VSLEARVPLLDHRLVEFAASLPSHLKLKGHRRKHLLKRVSRAWLPAAIVNRPKKGFPIPVSTWFRHEAREFVHDLLSPSALSRRGLFDQRAVGRLLAEHDSGFADHGSQIWGLLSVELWHRLYVDSAFGRRPAPGPDRVTGATGRSTVLPATPPPDAR
jgi:asparagine synthase (glutamine-hydrolysing)